MRLLASCNPRAVKCDVPNDHILAKIRTALKANDYRFWLHLSCTAPWLFNSSNSGILLSSLNHFDATEPSLLLNLAWLADLNRSGCFLNHTTTRTSGWGTVAGWLSDPECVSCHEACFPEPRGDCEGGGSIIERGYCIAMSKQIQRWFNRRHMRLATVMTCQYWRLSPTL